MIYAMNLYDIIDDKEEMYKEYLKQSIELLEGIDAEPVVAGEKPLDSLYGQARQHFLIMKFGSKKDFDLLMQRQEEQQINELREQSTSNYIWTLYEEWDVGHWLYG